MFLALQQIEHEVSRKIAIFIGIPCADYRWNLIVCVRSASKQMGEFNDFSRISSGRNPIAKHLPNDHP
mgnify:CR=1 FL=1